MRCRLIIDTRLTYFMKTNKPSPKRCKCLIQHPAPLSAVRHVIWYTKQRPPFSNLSVPPEQCAVHILSDEDNLLFSFYVNGSHEYRAGTSVGSTLFLVPGPQLIEVGLRSKRKLLGGLRSKKTDALTVACAAGATTFVQVEFPGFFAPKATLTELSAEEAQPIISRITSNSN